MWILPNFFGFTFCCFFSSKMNIINEELLTKYFFVPLQLHFMQRQQNICSYYSVYFFHFCKRGSKNQPIYQCRVGGRVRPSSQELRRHRLVLYLNWHSLKCLFKMSCWCHIFHRSNDVSRVIGLFNLVNVETQPWLEVKPD